PSAQATPAERGAAAAREAPARGAPRAAASPAAVPAASPAPAPARPAPPASAAPPVLAAESSAPQYQAAEQALGGLLRQLVDTQSSDLHLRVGEPPIFRTHGEMKRQAGERVPAEQLELMLLTVMPERNRAEWKESGDADFAYEIAGLARFRVNVAR